jgi:LPXTG-motif cell wall-anchored protein/uncharacterized repeat protein (TIGR01451 family)
MVLDPNNGNLPADTANFVVGDTARWQITVTNNNNVQVTDAALTDTVAPSCVTAFATAIGNDGTMNALETVTFSCDLVLENFGRVVNVASVKGTTTLGTVGPVEDTAIANVSQVAASAQIGDTVWSDENGNGRQDNGEKGIANATVRLTLPDGSTIDTTTNSNGLYLFAALEPGTYRAELILSSIPKPSDGGLTLTTPGAFTITLADGQSFLDADFGVQSTLPKTGISADQILLVGIALLMAGTLAVLATRKRGDGLGSNDTTS